MPMTRRNLLARAGLAAGLLYGVPPPLRALGSQARSPATPSPWRLPQKGGVRILENEWIAMADGTRLSARIWLPAPAPGPVPVVLEYIPYRKRDLYRFHDELWGRELAQYGIGYARVDVRGSGDSEGVLLDEYLEQELADGVEIIAWLARQPWSNGAVGMRGLSWGGINTLQIAARRPSALKAIMPMCCTDTRYTDDAHYIGGALGLTDLQWGVLFKAVMALPPDPAIAAGRWREDWHARLESAPPILEKWLRHQRNDAFWQRGSVSLDYAAIQCPVYVVDGWVDTYLNTVTRILEHVPAPRKALIGPWAHNYPESASPGPSLEWAHEEVRWWKQWLAGESTGILDEPMLRAYLPHRSSSETYPANTPGRWIAEQVWPSPHIAPRTWYLDEHRLAARPGAHREISYVANRIVGLKKPEWLPFPPEGMPGEQSPDDAKSLLFDSAPLGADLEILGHPRALIRIASDQPVAQLAVRLCELTAEGKSWLITYGLLNLTHRTGDERPSALQPGEFYDVEVDLSLIAHRFRAGSRIRLAVSESLWPLVWPSPRIATLTVALGSSRLELPVRAPVADPAFPIPVNANAEPPPGRSPTQERGPDAEGWYEIQSDPKVVSYPVGDTGTTLTGSMGIKELLKIKEGDNESCLWEGEHSTRLQRGDWDCTVFTAFRLTSSATTFFVEETLRAKEGDAVIFERIDRSAVPRDLM